MLIGRVMVTYAHQKRPVQLAYRKQGHRHVDRESYTPIKGACTASLQETEDNALLFKKLTFTQNLIAMIFGSFDFLGEVKKKGGGGILCLIFYT